MATYLLQHRHSESECAAAFAAWRGFASPLRGGRALCNCLDGRHEAWWQAEAEDAESALGQLPRFVAERTVAVRAREIQTP